MDGQDVRATFYIYFMLATYLDINNPRLFDHKHGRNSVKLLRLCKKATLYTKNLKTDGKEKSRKLNS